MSYTYSELTQAISDYAENVDQSFLSNVPLFTKLAELRIYRDTDLRCFRQHNMTKMTAGNPYINLPQANDIIIRSFKIRDVNNKYTILLPKNETFIRYMFPDETVVGRPRFYAHWLNTVLLIGPTPDYAYTVNMEFSALENYLAEGGDYLDGQPTDTNWVLQNGFDALLAASMCEAYSFMKEEEKAIAPEGSNAPGLWSQRYTDAVKRLQVQEARERVDDFRAQDPR